MEQLPTSTTTSSTAITHSESMDSTSTIPGATTSSQTNSNTKPSEGDNIIIMNQLQDTTVKMPTTNFPLNTCTCVDLISYPCELVQMFQTAPSHCTKHFNIDYKVSAHPIGWECKAQPPCTTYDTSITRIPLQILPFQDCYPVFKIITTQAQDILQQTNRQDPLFITIYNCVSSLTKKEPLTSTDIHGIIHPEILWICNGTKVTLLGTFNIRMSAVGDSLQTLTNAQLPTHLTAQGSIELPLMEYSQFCLRYMATFHQSHRTQPVLEYYQKYANTAYDTGCLISDSWTLNAQNMTC